MSYYKPRMVSESERRDFSHPELPLLTGKGDVVLVYLPGEGCFSNVPRYCDYISTAHTWGYEGEGPAGLGFDTLYHYTGDYEFSAKNARVFNAKILGNLHQRKNHVIDKADIEKFIDARKRENESHKEVSV